MIAPALDLTVPATGFAFFEASLRNNEASENKNPVRLAWPGRDCADCSENSRIGIKGCYPRKSRACISNCRRSRL